MGLGFVLAVTSVYIVEIATTGIVDTFCIPESFNMNISHQLFDHKITFVIKNCQIHI